jgi:heptaprenyl diphosphate synthase
LESEIPEILDDLRDCGAIDRAYAQARREMLEALFYLEPFPKNQYRVAMERLTRFIVERRL